MEPTITAAAPAAIALAMSPEKRIPPSAITGIPVPSSASTASETAVICGTPYAGHDTGSTDGARANAYFHRTAAGFRQAQAPCASGDVAADDLQVWVFRTCFTNTLQERLRSGS